MKPFDLDSPKGYADMIEYAVELFRVDPASGFQYLREQMLTMNSMYHALADSIEQIAEHHGCVDSMQIVDLLPSAEEGFDLLGPTDSIRWQVELVGWTNGVELSWAPGYPREVYDKPVALFIHTAVIEEDQGEQHEPEETVGAVAGIGEGRSVSPVADQDA